METSGQVRRLVAERGHDVISCDLLPADDGGSPGRHIQGDVFETLEGLRVSGWWPDRALFHPDCTFHTNAAAWAFGDGPYHQQVKPGTAVGRERRERRERSRADVDRIATLKIARIIVENPIGSLHQVRTIGKPSQIVQPYELGDDASKATCFWYLGEDWMLMQPLGIPIDPSMRVAGRLVEWPRGSGEMVERWVNQTDSGQNRLSPGDDRWKERSGTYPGIAKGLADLLCK